jgi:hypothetical protein
MIDNVIPAVVSSLFLIALAIGFFLRDRARRLERKRALSAVGFKPCADETEFLVDVVTEVENNSVYWYSVDHPMQSVVGGKPCYVYTKLRMLRTRVDAVEEFLVSMSRPSKEGLLLLVETGSPPIRSVRHWGEMLHPGIRVWHPHDLTFLELPSDMDRGQIMGAFGPPGTRLLDLIDLQTFDRIKEVGDLGVSTITFRGDWCSFSCASARTTLSIKGLLSLAGRLSTS